MPHRPSENSEHPQHVTTAGSSLSARWWLAQPHVPFHTNPSLPASDLCLLTLALIWWVGKRLVSSKITARSVVVFFSFRWQKRWPQRGEPHRQEVNHRDALSSNTVELMNREEGELSVAIQFSPA